jgi:hypothetical protein
LLWRLRNGELDGYHARAIVLNIGGNDLKTSWSTDRVVAGIRLCLDEIRLRQPQAVILFTLPPEVHVPVIVPQAYQDHVAAVDRELRKLDDGHSIQVLDISDGLNKNVAEILLQVAMTGDPHKVHLWFEIWWDALKAPLDSIFSAPQP